MLVDASRACIFAVVILTDGMMLSAAVFSILSANLTYANNKNVYDICVVEEPKTNEAKS